MTHRDRSGAGHLWSSRAGRGFGCLELDPHSRMDSSGRRHKLASVSCRCGAGDTGGVDRALQSTLTLSSSPVHGGDGEGSSSEKTAKIFN